MAISRRGLTLVEVLVIALLALIGLGVLLMYLLQARQAARRADCQNNLKILGQAIYYYDGAAESLRARGLTPKARGPAQNALPAARIADGYATWPVQLGPYLANQNPLADWDTRKPYAQQPAAAREMLIPQLFCPARAREFKLSRSGDGPADNIAGAVGDYACAAGNGDPKHDWTGPDANGAIILGQILDKKDDLILAWISRTTFADLERGRSNTILLGEKHVPPDGFGQARFGDGSVYNGQHPASFSRIGGPGFGLAHSPTAAFNNNFGSAHRGLCHFLMADLSVPPMSNSINEDVLGKLIVRGKQ